MRGLNIASVRNQFPFLRRKITLPDGSVRTPVYLNAAATCQVTAGVLSTVNKLAAYYGPVGRGNGTIQREATALYTALCRKALGLVKADPNHFDADFTGPNATMALNLLICGLDLKPGNRVIHTVYDHNSLRNPLYMFHPDKKDITMIGLSERKWPPLDLDQMHEEIKAAGRKLRLVALTHASNLTGDILPIHQIASWAHRANPRAIVLVDAAQTFSHIPIEMGVPDDPAHIDMLVACGHKCNAPFGSALYIAPKKFLGSARPLVHGGGTIAFVSQRYGIDLLESKERLRAGSPNLIGAAAFMKAMEELMGWGLADGLILKHELALREHFLKELSWHVDVEPYKNPRNIERLGHILFFTKDGLEDLAKVLETWGISFRTGPSCANELGLAFAKNLWEVDFDDLSPNWGAELAHLRQSSIARPGECALAESFLRLTPGVFTSKEEMSYVAKLVNLAAEKHPFYGWLPSLPTLSQKVLLENIGLRPPIRAAVLLDLLNDPIITDQKNYCLLLKGSSEQEEFALATRKEFGVLANCFNLDEQGFLLLWERVGYKLALFKAVWLLNRLVAEGIYTPMTGETAESLNAIIEKVISIFINFEEARKESTRKTFHDAFIKPLSERLVAELKLDLS